MTSRYSSRWSPAQRRQPCQRSTHAREASPTRARYAGSCARATRRPSISSSVRALSMGGISGRHQRCTSGLKYITTGRAHESASAVTVPNVPTDSWNWSSTTSAAR